MPNQDIIEMATKLNISYRLLCEVIKEFSEIRPRGDEYVSDLIEAVYKTSKVMFFMQRGMEEDDSGN
jgi:hypothetical protein